MRRGIARHPKKGSWTSISLDQLHQESVKSGPYGDIDWSTYEEISETVRQELEEAMWWTRGRDSRGSCLGVDPHERSANFEGSHPRLEISIWSLSNISIMKLVLP